MRTAFALFILVGSLAACSSASGVGASYDAETGMTSYTSARIPLGRSTTAAAYGSGTAIVMEAQAECPGEGCSPETYVVSLRNTSPNEMATEFNQVIFSTPQGTVSFEPGVSVSGETTTFFSSGRGELVRIVLPRDIFNSFATSQEFSIRLGSNEFRIPYNARSSMRKMIPGLPENQ